ncbi:hypothetical protein BJ170DRAFT_581280 [Xylariales sp. AK1849]|nr:hypothetical protein BJ170DRAFT_581280 [Xylariales sp. AK1849]
MKTASLIFIVYGAIWSASASDTIQHPIQAPLSTTSESPTSPLLTLHRSLVEISSISGRERDVSDFLKEYLQGHGFTVETQDVVDDRENILAYLGESRKTKVLLTSHIDTVPPFWPYERKSDEIWGRGTVDAKGSVAAQIIAVESLVDEGKIVEGDVALLFVVGEENSGIGMQTANDLGLSWGTVIFGEPTELKLARGHKGGMGFTIKARGKAGHSGYPELGKNAIDMLVRGLAALQELKLPWSEEYGNTTVNVGSIQGGVASNVIPDEASARALVRIATGNITHIQTAIENAVHKACPELEIEFTAGRSVVPIDHDIEGFETIVESYGTDIPNLKGSHKRYLYGPGTILVAHSDHEHLKVKDLETAVQGYKTLITESLK